MPAPQRPSDLDNLRKLGKRPPSSPAPGPNPARRRGGLFATSLVLLLAATAGYYYWPAAAPAPATPAPVTAPAAAPADAPVADTGPLAPAAAATGEAATPAPFAVEFVEVGTEVDANLRVVMPRSRFGTRETLRASIGFSGATDGVDLVATWMWLGKGPVARVIQPLDNYPGQVLVLTLEASGSWPAGDYALVISRDDAELARREFSFGD